MSNGFDMCDNHTYLFATEGKDCPYCEIDRIKAELEFEQFSAKHNEEVVKERIAEVKDLERQLADLKERYECKADALGAALLTIDEYEKQLAEAKASAQAWHDNCNIMEAELDKERNKHAETVGKLSEARAELDRYKAGVEVEGLFDVQYGLNLCSSETHKLDNSVRYGKVRVLIMKLEG